MSFIIKRATVKDLEIIDYVFVLNLAEEVKKQFPRRNMKSILEEV